MKIDSVFSYFLFFSLGGTLFCTLLLSVTGCRSSSSSSQTALPAYVEDSDMGDFAEDPTQIISNDPLLENPEESPNQANETLTKDEEEESTAPLIIWGEDGIPILNEELLAKEEAKKAKENTPPKTEPTDTRFIIRTNLPLNTSPSKTRLQEFNEFISRINNKKHTIAIPDIPGSPEEAKPLFSQQELTFTNHAGTEVRLVTSFETKIQLVNERLKFVVLDYSFEPMPPMETRLAIYREGQKIGLVKVTGPIKNGNVIAVILEGFPQVGDTVIREVY